MQYPFSRFLWVLDALPVYSHIGYLEALLTMESEERDRHAIQQRLRDTKLPRLKTLEEFDMPQVCHRSYRPSVATMTDTSRCSPRNGV
ncbi:MAG TPA: hypothetical protein VI386_11790 [Candidatus Sulfotelmatobacter sp.]